MTVREQVEACLTTNQKLAILADEIDRLHAKLTALPEQHSVPEPPPAPIPHELRGVYLQGKRWVAKYKGTYLGSFPTQAAAAAARAAARQKDELRRQYGTDTVTVVLAEPTPSLPTAHEGEFYTPADLIQARR